jgi:5-methyltetrahydrofolate--homocysteine methyltransferase
MSGTEFLAAVRAGRARVSDGAWGTMLQARGLTPGECPEDWCRTRPDEVAAVARAYADAGADMVQTNSFGGTRLKLASYGLADAAAEINEAAARCSRAGAGPDRAVIASVGPSGKMMLTGETTEEELLDAFTEQCAALLKGGADAICVETMSDPEEAALAVRAARAAGAEAVICTYTFERTVQGDYRTMFGTAPGDAARAALEAGADIIGANCGNGMEQMIPIAAALRAAFPGTPILIHANAGLPVVTAAGTAWPESPETMAARAPALRAAGADILGGCCGTTPAHIAALRRALDAAAP